MRLEDVPDDGCAATADGAVLVARCGDEVVAWENRCLHKGQRLDGGLVRDGIVTCPGHFWRYRLADGRLLNGVGRLHAVPVRVVDGAIEVDEVPAAPVGSLRDRLLEHARTWSREA